jgi:hypothetical protein
VSIASLALAMLLLSVPSAFAQELPNGEKRQLYRELITKALQEYSLGHWPEARVFFTDAHALWPNARTLRGLGMASYEERSYVAAIGYLELAIVHKTQPLTSKLATEAQSILEQAKRFVTVLRIEVSPEGARVTVDDEPPKYRPDGSVLLDPGEHSVQVESPGYASERRVVRAEAGREVQLRFVLVAERGGEGAADHAVSTGAGGSPVELNHPATTTATEPLAITPDRLTLAGQNAMVAGALSAAGLAGIATGWVFYALRDKARVDLWTRSVFASSGDANGFPQSVYTDFRTRGGIAMAAAGAGVLTLSTAQYFWLPDDPATPVWAWVVGGVGSAIALGALAWAVWGKHCEVTDPHAVCQSTTSDALFAPMLGIQAIPFLTLPLFYELRQRVSLRDTIVTAGWNEGSMQLSIAGSF